MAMPANSPSWNDRIDRVSARMASHTPFEPDTPRNRERFGGGAGYAKDPVCGMQVETAHAPASTLHNGERIYFCSEHCAHRFSDNPDRYLSPTASAGHEGDAADDGGGAVDPVCGMTVDPACAADSVEHHGRAVYFCSTGCRDAFVADPDGYLSPTASAGHEGDAADGGGEPVDPVCGMTVDPACAAASVEHHGRAVYFCSAGCRDAFVADPQHYGAAAGDGEDGQSGVDLDTLDPVCGMTVDPARAAAHVQHRGRTVSFCATGCADAFRAHPDRYLPETATDPVCAMTVAPETAAAHRRGEGEAVWFCSAGCARQWDADRSVAVRFRGRGD